VRADPGDLAGAPQSVSARDLPSGSASAISITAAESVHPAIYAAQDARARPSDHDRHCESATAQLPSARKPELVSPGDGSCEATPTGFRTHRRRVHVPRPTGW
jgi:hypothetical protein